MSRYNVVLTEDPTATRLFIIGVNFFGNGCDEQEIELYVMPAVFTLPQILKRLKLTKSTSQAIGNKWDKEIVPGLNEFVYGKLRDQVVVFSDRGWAQKLVQEVVEL